MVIVPVDVVWRRVDLALPKINVITYIAATLKAIPRYRQLFQHKRVQRMAARVNATGAGHLPKLSTSFDRRRNVTDHKQKNDVRTST